MFWRQRSNIIWLCDLEQVPFFSSGLDFSTCTMRGWTRWSPKSFSDLLILGSFLAVVWEARTDPKSFPWVCLMIPAALPTQAQSKMFHVISICQQSQGMSSVRSKMELWWKSFLSKVWCSPRNEGNVKAIYMWCLRIREKSQNLYFHGKDKSFFLLSHGCSTILAKLGHTAGK